MNMEDLKHNRLTKFALGRLGIDEKAISELEASQKDLLLMHRLLSEMLPELHDILHGHSAAGVEEDTGPVPRDTIVAGKCLVWMAKTLYAERFGTDRLTKTIEEEARK